MKQSNEIDGWFDYPDVIDFLLNNTPDNGIFVEAGAWLGKSSSYLCDQAKNRVSIFIIDTWAGSANELTTSQKLATTTDIYQIFLENMGDRKFTSIRKNSIEASKDFQDKSCDIIFIDMEHTYEAVKQDLHAWYPKLKIGGYIAGHDYNESGWPGVVKAVNEFFNFPQNPNLTTKQGCWIYYKSHE